MTKKQDNLKTSFNIGANLNPAADLIRQKISGLYNAEPNATEEALELSTSNKNELSRHQKYMLDLTNSGKTMSEIQIDWHDYYASLSDEDKHQVWKEFYSAQAEQSKSLHSKPLIGPGQVSFNSKKLSKRRHQPKSIESKQLIPIQKNKSRLTIWQHFHSLLFGLSIGALMIFILLFGFFNERFIAPFITPSKSVSNIPIISDSTTAVGSDPLVIIPKINVEIPVVYDQPSVDEKAVQSSLENGVVHYADTALPGENGNLVIVGHSSNNIFNKGKYKFAFVLLSRMQKDDIFMLQKDGKRYTYKVYERKIIKPTDTDVLGTQEKAATATLITCDPPGTSLNRLVVIGEQISPDPLTNLTSGGLNELATTKSRVIPGNAPSLWSRLVGIFTN